MPRYIPLSSTTRIRRARCHVGYTLALEVGAPAALPVSLPAALVAPAPGSLAWRPVDMREREKLLVNFIGRLVPPNAEDDPIIVEAGTEEAAQLPPCCAATARVYLPESDRTRVADRLAWGLAVLASVPGSRVADPVALGMSMLRNVVVSLLPPGALLPGEISAHAIEIVYVADDVPLPAERFQRIEAAS